MEGRENGAGAYVPLPMPLVKSFVVCPASARFHWRDELGRWLPGELQSPGAVSLPLTLAGTLPDGALCHILSFQHAVVLADTQKNWNIACLLEEVPNARTLGLHEVIIKDLVKSSQLLDQANKTTPGGPAIDDDG